MWKRDLRLRRDARTPETSLAAAAPARVPEADNPAPRLHCRSCGAKLSTTFVDLGMTPISNAFVPADRASAPERVYPLRSFVCDSCHLVQLEDFETPAAHFHDGYVYFSSFAASWVDHARRYVEMALDRFRLGPDSHVVEIASNDGYLLQHFVRRGVPCLGVDPSTNCAEAARARGVQTETCFFGRGTAQHLRSAGKAADLIVANNVLAHVPDLNDFVAGLKVLLKPEGTITIEFPHLLALIDNSLFDTIYHEHYSYLSLLALRPLFERHGLAVTDLEQLPTHGGSLRLYVRHEGAGGAPSLAVQMFQAQERAAGLDGRSVYLDFGRKVRETKRALLTLLIDVKNRGKSIAGYGAPAKGNTLLNYCGIGTDFLDFTVDANPHKQGMLLPGTRIPVHAPEKIFETKPDYVLVLPWNLKDEITAQLGGIRGWGGRFILPLPHPQVLD